MVISSRVCGDGSLDPGEECDDGEMNSNAESGACRTNCRAAFCGDAVLDEGEQCDDGNADDGDGCTWKCVVSVCGNGSIEAPEECDAGDENADDVPNMCRTVCRKPFCGDGVPDAGEECDDANLDDEDGCLKSCVVVCGEGESKIQGRCVQLVPAAETCGIGCTAKNAWSSFADWLFGLFERK